jgi:D-threo-aldose 1-dehydrogenase
MGARKRGFHTRERRKDEEHEVRMDMDGVTAVEHVRLGRSPLQVSRLSLGTAAFGGLYSHVEDSEASAVVHRALELGLSYLDTAPLYGHGTSERRLSAALAGVERSRFVLSTKVGRLVVADADGEGDTGLFADAPPSHTVFDFSADGIRRSLDASLERLGLDRVDVVYLHDPDDPAHTEQALGQAYPVLHQLRAEGVVGAIGLGMNQWQVPLRFVRETDLDVVLLAGRWTLLDRSGGLELLPECLLRGVAVVAGGVFNSGLLADPREGAMFDYAAAAPRLVERAQAMAALCGRHGVALTAAALQFPLRHPAVTSVLTGVRSVAELESNHRDLTAPIPDDLWAELDRL